jgi:protein-serine/threonine kinase
MKTEGTSERTQKSLVKQTSNQPNQLLKNSLTKGTAPSQERTTTQPDEASLAKAKRDAKLTVEDFIWVKVIGRGSFGKVYLVQKKSNKKYYALKTLKKEDIIARELVVNAFTEKNVLQNSAHPFVVKLRYSFQTESTLYLVMDYLPGGELFHHLKKRGRFDEDTARFYACEVILAIEYIHDKLDIMYRDLKPENILLDSSGHIKVTDFGLSTSTKKAFSFSGTPEYFAPEILAEKGYDKSVDWWSLGCLLYEMLAGQPPYKYKTKPQLFNDILNNKPIMPSYFSKESVDLLSRLMTKNPEERLGFKGSVEIKEHPFFKVLDWEEISSKKRNPPIVPILTKADDVRNFDKTFVNEPVKETPPMQNPKLATDPRNNFNGFSYFQNEILNQSLDESKQGLLGKI